MPELPERNWSVAWLAGIPIGIGNGLLREATYAKWLTRSKAHLLSSVSAVAAFSGLFEFLARRWPLRTKSQAARVGVAWVSLTVVSEFGFGLLVAKQSWRDLVAQYDIRSSAWPLVLAWLGLGPLLLGRRRG